MNIDSERNPWKQLLERALQARLDVTISSSGIAINAENAIAILAALVIVIFIFS